MEARKITETQLRSFHNYLIREEKITATVEKYLRDVRAFVVFVGGNAVTKEEQPNDIREICESQV